MSTERVSTGGFENVDATGDPEAYFAYLERISNHPGVRALNRRRAERAGIARGTHVLDVGCGVGADSEMLAELVGSCGRVVAVDSSTAMVERARMRFAKRGLGIEARVCDAQSLDFDDGSFDVCWTERVLVHVADPTRVAAEMRRVLRPGGRAVVTEGDYDDIIIDATDAELTRRIIACAASRTRHPRIGRQIRRLFLEAGFERCTVYPELRPVHDLAFVEQVQELRVALRLCVEQGRLTEDEAKRWYEELEDFDRTGRFLLALPFFVLVAERGSLGMAK
jgi:ubiquinone/menaquinone biosynthesis C-methylase UbiE